MPYVEIAPEKLEHLELFGFRVLGRFASGLVVGCPKGDGEQIMLVERERPHLWFDDINDAMQLGAKAIIQMPPS